MTKIKKGLFIGIDYLGQSAELANCRNDAKDMYNMIQERYGIDEAVLLLDDSPDDKKPTRANMTRWLKWLSSNNQEGDVLWLHYSGHGGYTRDTSGDEADGKDETLIPVDYSQTGQISDDELNRILCQPIVQQGATLFFHDDCCHSGTGADLRFRLTEVQKTTNIIEETETEATDQEMETFKPGHWYNPFTNQKEDSFIYFFHNAYYTMKEFWLQVIIPHYRSHRPGRAPRPSHRVLVKETRTKKRTTRDSTMTWETMEDYTAPQLAGTGNIFKWSGCMDDQTSADGFAGMDNGAMTGSVITVLYEGKAETWGQFLKEVRSLLKTHGFTQIPQLCFSQRVSHEDQCFNI